MLRLLLCQPPHRDTFGYSMPPLGPLHLGAAARAAGHTVSFVDLALAARRGELPLGEDLIPSCAERLLAAEPDVLGLSAMISSMPAVLHLAAEVKRRRPETLIALGGQGPEAVEEALVARYPQLDAVAVGEGERTLVEWLAALDGDEQRDAATLFARNAACEVAGLVVRRGGHPHRTPPREVAAALDELPRAAWDLAETPRAYRDAAGSEEAMFPVDLGRGCSFACTFCTTPTFWGRASRWLSPAAAVDELERLSTLDGLDVAYVTHDLFTGDRAHVLALCAEKIARRCDLPWECRTRIDLVDAELLAALREAGCRRILYGVESDSPRVLRLVNKGGRLVTSGARGAPAFDTRAVLRLAADQGLASIVGVLCGVPGETADDVEANLRLLAEVAGLPGVSLSLHWYNVTPGNGRAAETEGRLRLLPGLSADLVRGFDLPAGYLPEAQAALVRQDAEVFSAFRVFTPGHASERQLYLLSRHAHVLLETLPRTTLALAAAAHGGSVLLTLKHFLDALAPGDGPAEDWEEPLVLTRAAAVRRFAEAAAAGGDPLVAALAGYERALLETQDVALVHFAVDPVPLVRAMARGEWPPREERPAPATLRFERRGERVRAARLSPFLADAAHEPDDRTLRRRWPGCTTETLATARALLAGEVPP